jgi:hypothetical protein
MSEPWSMHKPHKWLDNLENSITDDMIHDITTHYAVNEVSELSDDQIMNLEEYIFELEEMHGMELFRMCIRNVINIWEDSKNEHDSHSE